MDLSKRQSQLLKILKNSSQEITGNDLANLLNVTSRTIRNEVKQINSLLEVKCIQSNTQGYYIDCDAIEWMKFVDVEDDNLKNQLLRILLANENILYLDALCDQFYMGRKRFLGLVNDIIPILKEFHLAIELEQNRISIIGSEFDKRALISSLIYHEANNDIVDLQTLSSFFSEINLLELKQIVSEVIKKYHYFIKDYYGDNLVLNLAIAISRIKKGFILEGACFSDITWEVDVTSQKMLVELKEILEKTYDISIDEHNMEYLRGLLLGLMKPVYLHNYIRKVQQESDENIYLIMSRILTKVFDYFMLKIDKDEFLLNFVVHINAMINRCRLNINVNNLLQYNLQYHCPFVYEVAVFIASEIEKIFQIRIPDSEIGFIAIHIGFAIENSIDSTKKVKILLLSGNYIDIQKKIASYIEDKYENKIEMIYQENYSIQSSVDLIISAVESPMVLIDTVQISPFLTLKDKMLIDEAIRKCEKTNSNKYIKKNVIQCFHENLFFKNNANLNKEECIAFLGKKLEDFGVVPNGYTNLVIDRENLSSTCFFDQFAIPHSIELNAYKTTIAVMLSKNPIQWGHQKVKFVMMLAINNEDRKDFMELYDGIIDLLCNYQNLNHILEAKDYEDFIDILLKSVN